MIRLHHLNCGSLCPRLGKQLLNPKGTLVCHCLLIETSQELILIDTGLGIQDIQAPHARLGSGFVYFAHPVLSIQETALNYVAQLGFSRQDVRHIIPTHLDVDHAGGLSDFPEATVHIFQKEHQAAIKRLDIREQHRYRPSQWAHGVQWLPYQVKGEKWFGFDCVRELEGVSEEILLIPLIGHTRGHCGVALKIEDRWVLHAGDAYFCHQEIHGSAFSCPPALSLFQTMMQMEALPRINNQKRLQELVQTHGDQITVFCAHDPDEYEQQVTHYSSV